MALKISKDGDTVTIMFPEIFGFSLRREFKEATSSHRPGIRYQLDLRTVTKIDSSALGMLLLFREGAGGESADISFIGVRPEVRRLLQLANFQNLFKFS
ncbi:MAG: hypothetical protein HW380_695 [Magnetococcales bacterium]|nr:hypothetical protein [Magnetococcales bacterium]HIJ83460.1 STAS domain-containing protein [Magnetococcales bacterium]